MSRKSNLPPETLELYKRVFETYLQEIKADPDYSFAEHCAKWDVKASSLNARLWTGLRNRRTSTRTTPGCFRGRFRVVF